MEENIIDEFLKNGTIIVFDTNVWLDIYRVLPDEIANTLTLLNKDAIKNKLFIPSFVNTEFLKQYHSLISEHNLIVEKVKSQLKDTIAGFKIKTLGNVEQIRERHRVPIDEIVKKLESKFGELNKIADEFLEYNDTQNILDDEGIVDRVKSFFEEIYNTQKIDCLNKDELFEIFTEGEQRYKNKIPPGYMDKSKNEKGGFIYGDLIIWKEIVKYAKEQELNVLFVTNDVKEDWFDENGFHSKLVGEFERETNHKIIGLMGYEFYNYAKNKYLTAAETLTDIDTYIDDHKEEFIDNIYSELYDRLNSELYYSYGSENKIYDPWDILSEYDGSLYEYDDFDDLTVSKIKCNRNGSSVIIDITFDVEFTVYTAEYFGRDDDTHEVILSPERTHKVKGTINVLLDKPASEFLFDLENYALLDIKGAVEETEYNDGCGDEY